MQSRMHLCRPIKLLQISLFVASFAVCLAPAQDDKPAHLSMATEDRWKNPGWWPTKGTPALREYTGPEACTRCHAEIAASQQTTPMFKAASLASDATLLQQHPELRFSDETYNYVLSRGPKETKFTVTKSSAKDNSDAVSAVVGWAFGLGEISQTYVIEKNGTFLESRLSHFRSLRGLDITPGHTAPAPDTPEQALGDRLGAKTIRRCFGCHATASTTAGTFDPEHAVLGVTCEACHGPGAQHVIAMDAGQYDAAASTTLNPKRLSPVDSVDFCGACHRTPVDVVLDLPPHIGVTNVRFQPKRLERSLCWGTSGDPRITCMACHDPHKPLVRDSTAYDANCLQCHAGPASPPSAKLEAACKVGTKDCVSCHMPKYEIPWVHGTFTDHFIRIVRDDAPFPE